MTRAWHPLPDGLEIACAVDGDLDDFELLPDGRYARDLKQMKRCRRGQHVTVGEKHALEIVDAIDGKLVFVLLPPRPLF